MLHSVLTLIIVVLIATVAVGGRALLKRELAAILSDVAKLRNRLAQYAEDKAEEIAEHMEEATHHTGHAKAKRADADRATRIANRLDELLQ